MEMNKASIGARFGAMLLDYFFINLICAIIAVISIEAYFIILPVSSILYFGILEGSSMSATFGKRICGIHVVDEYGNKLSSGKGFLRSLCKILSSILSIGYIIALFSDDKQALHDKMVHTYVVKDAVPGTVPAPAPVPRPVNVNPVVSPIGGINQMNAQLIGLSGQYAGKAFQVTETGLLVGTDVTVCNVVFPQGSPGISRTHCKVSFNPQTRMFVLNDLGSTYGTFLSNGVKVNQGQPVALNSGESFYLAASSTTFRVNC